MRVLGTDKKGVELWKELVDRYKVRYLRLILYCKRMDVPRHKNFQAQKLLRDTYHLYKHLKEKEDSVKYILNVKKL